MQLLSAMSYLHRSSIAHRDLKSSNVLITGEGCLKVGRAQVGVAQCAAGALEALQGATRRVPSLPRVHLPRALAHVDPCVHRSPVQIADFGLSTVLHDDGDGHLLTKTVVGTPNYMSPCVLQVCIYDDGAGGRGSEETFVDGTGPQYVWWTEWLGA